MAAAQLPFKLVTPTGILFDQPVREVTAVNVRGEFGVLPEHVNFITALLPGILTVVLADGGQHFYLVSGGLAEVRDGQLTVLARTAERAEDVTGDDLTNALMQAEEKLRRLSFYEPEYQNAQNELQLVRARQQAMAIARSAAH
ncbi:MAG TPA: ATP synthase F1 subunit epsilon [Candidatus Binataceae bacterium]|nr:ATP synthase F1 subunit epsilon [Candidatus Binataceae bacterium]